MPKSEDFETAVLTIDAMFRELEPELMKDGWLKQLESGQFDFVNPSNTMRILVVLHATFGTAMRHLGWDF